MRRSAAAVAAAALALPAAAGASARPYPCPGVDGFTCHRLAVPLDRTGAIPGRIVLRYATAPRRGRGRVLVALTGGPGQPGVAFGPSFERELGDLAPGYRIVVLDQRGTGGSRVLDCPEVQALDGLDALFSEDVAGCARRLGPQRSAFSTAETVDDLEAIRRALGASRIAIFGVSYGTYVAQQYARAYPDRVDRLALDSVVAPGYDPWNVGITRALPRVLRELCRSGRCRGITSDPVADLAAVVARTRAGGALRGTIRGPQGVAQPTSLTESQLLSLLVASDLNPFLQARLPGALAAAREGDLVPLLRLRRDAAGPRQALRDFSAGLFVTTTCLDQQLPYSYADGPAERARKAAAALAALPDADIAPFDRAAMDVSSVAEICLRWPAGPIRAPSSAPLPDVPTLVLSGSTDLRTSLEGAQALAGALPRAQVVTLAGAGHDVGDTDTTGCVARALRRFFAARPVGRPCARRSVGPPPVAVPPRSLAAVPAVAAVPGLRGRVLRAALATAQDAGDSDNEAYAAGFEDPSGGGLRGGRYIALPTGAGDLLLLERLVYVPGVRVDGAVFLDGRRVVGRVRVRGPRGMSGTLELGGRIRGRLGGRRVDVALRTLARRPAGAARRRVARFRLPVP